MTKKKKLITAIKSQVHDGKCNLHMHKQQNMHMKQMNIFGSGHNNSPAEVNPTKSNLTRHVWKNSKVT